MFWVPPSSPLQKELNRYMRLEENLNKLMAVLGQERLEALIETAIELAALGGDVEKILRTDINRQRAQLTRTLAERLREEAQPNHNTGLIDKQLLTAAADALEAKERRVFAEHPLVEVQVDIPTAKDVADMIDHIASRPQPDQAYTCNARCGEGHVGFCARKLGHNGACLPRDEMLKAGLT